MVTMYAVPCGILFMILLQAVLGAGTFNFPRNITRHVGSTNTQIFCSKYPVEATPFWKINDTTYYFSEVTPPFTVSPSGRAVTIPVTDVSLNQTSFQCFVPTSDGIGGLFSSPLGILTVLTTDIDFLTNTSYKSSKPQIKLTLNHQQLCFDKTSFMLAWKVFGLNHANYYFELNVTDTCSHSSSTRSILVNTSTNTELLLQPESLQGENINSTFFSLKLYDMEQNKTIQLESFQLHSGIITETIPLCLNYPSCTSATPSWHCMDVPPLTGTQTLVMAIPFTPMDSSTPDILCPIHLHSGERCVNLLSCNRFSESAYANSITICRTVDNDPSLEMCFHNVTEAINGTKIHFFYSDLLCSSDVTITTDYKSSRTYIRSMQLIVDYQEKTPTTATLPEFDTTRGTESPSLNTLGFLISGFILTFTAGLGVGITCSCFLCLCLQKKKSSNVQGDTVTFTENPAYDVIHFK